MEEAPLSYSFTALLLFGLLYSLAALIWYLKGISVSWAWVTIIPVREYYLWEALFMVPVCVQVYVLSAALAHLFSRLQHGKGSFESTLAVFGFAYIPLIISFWLPDMVLNLLFGIETLLALVPFYATISGLWSILLSGLGLKMSQQIPLPRAFLTASVSIALGNTLTLLLIR